MKLPQKGAVLLFTLIVLVAMLFATVAMMHSVGTSGILAGNLVFREAAIREAYVGIYSAIKALEPCGVPVCGMTSSGSYILLQQQSQAFFLDYNTWESSSYVHTLPASDMEGQYTVQYIIDRLSDGSLSDVNDSDLVEAHSLGYIAKDTMGSKDAKNEGEIITIPSVFYRVTVRVVGPNRTNYLVQAIVTISNA